MVRRKTTYLKEVVTCVPYWMVVFESLDCADVEHMDGPVFLRMFVNSKYAFNMFGGDLHGAAMPG